VRVASDLSLERARIDGGDQHAITADGAVIDGSLRAAEMRTTGEVAIGTGRIGRRMILTEAQLDNGAGIALKLSGTEIGSDLFFRNATITQPSRRGAVVCLPSNRRRMGTGHHHRGRSRSCSQSSVRHSTSSH
jgi:hypothetical protein